MGVSSVSVSSLDFFVGGVIQPVFCGENKHSYKFNRHQERMRERKILFNYCFVYAFQQWIRDARGNKKKSDAQVGRV
jgi:hypothetical protein